MPQQLSCVVFVDSMPLQGEKMRVLPEPNMNLLLAFLMLASPLFAAESPIIINMRVKATKIHAGESPFFRVVLTNVGKKPLTVYDPLFLSKSNYAIKIRNADHSKIQGLYFIVTGPDGKPVQSWHPMFDGCGDVLSGNKSEPSVKPLRLAPGASVATKTWVFGGVCPGMRDNVPRPVQGFAELYNYRLDKPGVYHIAVAYENRWPCRQPGGHKDDEECVRYPQQPEEVNVETPSIEVEVVR